jgi:hypothetical protein
VQDATLAVGVLQREIQGCHAQITPYIYLTIIFFPFLVQVSVLHIFPISSALLSQHLSIILYVHKSSCTLMHLFEHLVQILSATCSQTEFIFHPKNHYRMILDASKKNESNKRERESTIIRTIHDSIYFITYKVTLQIHSHNSVFTY